MIVEVVTFILFLFSDGIVGIFPSADSEVLSIAKTMFLIEMFLEIGRVTNIIMVRALQTAGDVNFPILMSVAFTWCVSVLFGYIFGVRLKMGIAGIWIAMATDEILRGLVLTMRFRKGGWKKIDLISDIR